MYRILHTGRAGLDGLQKKMDVISNNIANVQTHGYKEMELQFEDLIYDEIPNKGVPLSREGRAKPIEIGTGSKVKTTERRFIQGILEESSGPYHLAIEGEGFFGVRGESGEVYLTRDGAFTIDSGGQLVDSRGNQVVMEVFSPLSQWRERGITIDERGSIYGLNNQGESIQIGVIRLFNVADKSMLISKGDNYFYTENLENLYTNEDDNEGWGSIRQGFLEKSNVNIGKELVDMLITQRAYQINTKSIHSADEMWGMVNQLKR